MNKYSGGDEILVDLFQILKDDAVKVLPSMCQQNWKTQQWPENWNRSFFIPIQKKGNAKKCSNYHIIALISHARKVMLKCLQADFKSIWTVNFHIFKLDWEKAEEPEIKYQHPLDHEKAREFQKNIYFCLRQGNVLVSFPTVLHEWMAQVISLRQAIMCAYKSGQMRLTLIWSHRSRSNSENSTLTLPG